jgi:hypothetical protein
MSRSGFSLARGTTQPVRFPAAAVFAALALVAAPASEAAVSLSASPATATMSSVTLNGVDQTSNTTVSLTVTGASQSGWQISAWAPRPAGAGGTLSAVSVPTEPALSPCGGKNCTNPAPTGISWPVTLGTTSGAATKIYNADVHTGDGTITISVPFSVTVPANALAGTYTSTITLTIAASGP